jgi:hypothetical protein
VYPTKLRSAAHSSGLKGQLDLCHPRATHVRGPRLSTMIPHLRVSFSLLIVCCSLPHTAAAPPCERSVSQHRILCCSVHACNTHIGPVRYMPKLPPSPMRFESVDVIPSLLASCGA